jgi:hypothetical protein
MSTLTQHLSPTQQGRQVQRDKRGRPFRSERTMGANFSLDAPARATPAVTSPTVGSPATQSQIRQAFHGPVPDMGESREMAAARVARQPGGGAPQGALTQWSALPPSARRQALTDRMGQPATPEQMNVMRTLGEHLLDPEAMRRWSEPGTLAAQQRYSREVKPELHPHFDAEGAEASRAGMRAATQAGIARAQLIGGQRPPADDIAPGDPALGQDVTQLRQRLGGDLGVQRMGQGRNVFQVGRPGFAPLLMGGQAAAERLSPPPPERADPRESPLWGQAMYRGERGTAEGLFGGESEADTYRRSGQQQMLRDARARTGLTSDEIADRRQQRQTARADRLADSRSQRTEIAREKADARRDRIALRQPGELQRRLMGDGGEEGIMRMRALQGDPQAQQYFAQMGATRIESEGQADLRGAEAELARAQAEQLRNFDPNNPPLTPEERVMVQQSGEAMYEQAIASGMNPLQAERHVQSVHPQFRGTLSLQQRDPRMYTGQPAGSPAGGYRGDDPAFTATPRSRAFQANPWGIASALGQQAGREDIAGPASGMTIPDDIPSADVIGWAAEQDLQRMLRAGMITPEQAARLRQGRLRRSLQPQ